LTGNNIDQCYDCHGSANDIRPLDTTPADALPSYRNITTGAIKGSHRTHNKNLPNTATAVNCSQCHGATTITSFNHRDGRIEMASGVGYNKGAGTLTFLNQTSVPTMGSCSTASCHVSSYSSAFIPTPAWGTVAGCTPCHNATLGAAAAFDATNGAPTTGAHTSHLSATSGVTCGNCHTNVDKNTNTSSVHIDGSINVTGYAAPVAKHTIGTGYNSCTVTCHGVSTSPNWSVSNPGSDTCTKCHGTLTGTVNSANRYVVAPPRNVAGTSGTVTGVGQVSSDAKVGAHQAHLQLFNGFSNYSTVDYRCEACHGTLPATGTHANGSSTPQGNFKNLATKWGSMSPTYSGTTCSNTYCHNPAGAGGTLNSANVGTNVNPSWTDATYLADGGKTVATNCSKCHKVPGDAGFTSTFNHGTTTIANTCNGCHDHEGNTAGTTHRHINGILWGGGGSSCDGCHDYDTLGTAPNKTWGTFKNANYGTFNEGNGAHAQHIEYLKTRWGGLTLNAVTDFAGGSGYGVGNPAKICGTCHTNNTGSHMSGGRVINFGDGLSTVGTSGQALLFSTSGTPLSSAYAGSSTTSSATQAKTCSNLSCHYFTTPVWSTY
jgi:predicted CxxxxCH...CXXCH cytochrome family protein